MKVPRCICCILLTLNLATLGICLEPVTIAVGGIIGSLFAAALLEPFRCRLTSCCNSRWITNNITGFESDMKSDLFGQHLANSVIFQHINNHVTTVNPPRALVLSFHGPTGVGKTLVSNIIAKNLYKDGQRSPFVHLISAMRDFPHHRMLSLYQNQLKTWITGNVTQCEMSMFIFEEVDKLPAGFLDILVPFIDYRKDINGINYHKSIFILLSNTGSSDIIKVTLDHYEMGKTRETLQLAELRKTIIQAIHEDKDYGLWQSQIMNNGLITEFIPFLPLEKVHVRKCINEAILANKHLLHTHQPEEIEKVVLSKLTFSPLDIEIFSDTGCKRVTEKLYDTVGK